jgi:hypothetical protein
MKSEEKESAFSFHLLLHHLFAAATVAAPFRPSQGSGFPPIFSIDRHTSRIQNSERKNSKTTVVESSLLRPLVFNFR